MKTIQALISALATILEHAYHSNPGAHQFGGEL
jgi:hypothetical protein